MASQYEPKSVMGWVFAAAGITVGIPVGIVKGALDKAQGGTFLEGAMDGCEATLDKAAQFGDEHGGKIARRVLRGLLIGIGLDLGHDLFDPHGDA